MHQMINEIREQIAPKGTYTTTVLAALMGISISHVNSMLQAGYLPEPERAGRAGGGWRLEWRGKALLEFAKAFDPAAVPPPDHDVYAVSTCYRLGCRCERCEQWHIADTRERRRAARPAFSEAQRAAVLAAIDGGSTLAEAAASVGLHAEAVKGYAKTEPELAEQLAQACWALCRRPDSCGTPGAYRAGCRGTGCTSWRREYGRIERGAATT